MNIYQPNNARMDDIRLMSVSLNTNQLNHAHNMLDSMDMVHVDINDHKDAPSNYCNDCNVPMDMLLSEYQCPSCGMITSRAEEMCDRDDVHSGGVRISTGKGRVTFYNINSEYHRTQKRMLMEQLARCHVDYLKNHPNMGFPPAVLHAAATQYNDIQRFVTEESDTTNTKKKFVRRSDIKNEVIATLVYFAGIAFGVTRKKRDCAQLLGLVTDGFARGEDIVRNLEADGKINLSVNAEPLDGFIGRYLESLDIETPERTAFITEIVNLSEQRKIGMSSQISSKIVGCIWAINIGCKLNIPVAAIEAATDGTKKNTFMKFYNCIIANFRLFAPIFKKYAVSR